MKRAAVLLGAVASLLLWTSAFAFQARADEACAITDLSCTTGAIGDTVRQAQGTIDQISGSVEGTPEPSCSPAPRRSVTLYIRSGTWCIGSPVTIQVAGPTTPAAGVGALSIRRVRWEMEATDIITRRMGLVGPPAPAPRSQRRRLLEPPLRWCLQDTTR